jgi:predicted O-linked N-acetylglucosamine transferase (SPINDLY family)
VQLSYLGFPGTMGNDAVDGLIGDAFLTPTESAHLYDEPLVLLPHCYQATRAWALPAMRPERRALGLPEDALVFCCFNNPCKIRPHVFEVWMRLLRRLPGSVLWLAGFNETCRVNLRQQAALHGIDQQRLIFAPLVSFNEHSARLPAADLFLDTFPYSAGATANQALGCAVPMLTIAGECYVSRMAASVLNALQLPELIAFDLEEYEEKAIELATRREYLAACRERLQDEAVRARVFDPLAGAHALEEAYAKLTQGSADCQGGRCCRGVSISAMRLGVPRNCMRADRSTRPSPCAKASRAAAAEPGSRCCCLV